MATGGADESVTVGRFLQNQENAADCFFTVIAVTIVTIIIMSLRSGVGRLGLGGQRQPFRCSVQPFELEEIILFFFFLTQYVMKISFCDVAE